MAGEACIVIPPPHASHAQRADEGIGLEDLRRATLVMAGARHELLQAG